MRTDCGLHRRYIIHCASAEWQRAVGKKQKLRRIAPEFFGNRCKVETLAGGQRWMGAMRNGLRLHLT